MAGKPEVLPAGFLGADLPPAARAPLLALGFLVLLAGMGGGLARLGIAIFPAFFHLPTAVQYHGVLMVGGFFGTLIALERAVALGVLWAYAAPLLAGTGALLLLAGVQDAGTYALLSASLVFVLASFLIWRKQRAFFCFVLLAAAACWATGNGLFLTQGVAGALPWWIAFFVLTIAGERLELNRLLPPRPGARKLFAAIALVLVGAAAMTVVLPQAGHWLTAISLAAMALWLGVNDVARRTVRGRGLPRYIAVSLLCGYAWLFAGAALMVPAGVLLRDAALHAVLVGFVFSMVFGHAPVIFPAVLRIRFDYTPWLYLPLALLHAALVVRIAGGLAGAHAAIAVGGGGNALAILLFIITMAGAAAHTALARRRRIAGVL